MTWFIQYLSSVKKDTEKLDPQVKRRIKDFLENRVANLNDPRSIGESLKGTLSEFWKYRVGDNRIICEIKDNELIILAVKIGNRRDVYKKVKTNYSINEN
jgi:mRNA interferase RelE/StbE